jgi:uncharacterized membrane protein
MVPSGTLARYMWLGDTPVEMVQSLFVQPKLVASHLLQRQTFVFIFTLLGPVLFMPLLSRLSIALLPAIAYNLLSSYPPQHTVYYQYVSPLVPFVVASTIYGTERLMAVLRARSRIPITYAVLVTLFTFSLWHASAVSNPLVDNGLVPSARDRLPNEAAVRRGLEAVPPGSALFTTNEYVPHLSHRLVLLVYTSPKDIGRMRDVDVVFLNMRARSVSPGISDCELNRSFLEFATADGFAISFHEDGVVVLSREPRGSLNVESVLGGTCG